MLAGQTLQQPTESSYPTLAGTDAEVRLASGPSTNNPNQLASWVELLDPVSEIWLPVCGDDSSFSEVAAQQICISLGYRTGWAMRSGLVLSQSVSILTCASFTPGNTGAGNVLCAAVTDESAFWYCGDGGSHPSAAAVQCSAGIQKPSPEWASVRACSVLSTPHAPACRPRGFCCMLG